MRNKLITSVVGGLFLLTSGLAFSTAHAAGSATLSMSPSGGTYNNGSTINVSVYENGNGTPATVVTAEVDYDASQLQFEGGSCAGAFSTEAGASSGSGSYTLTCFTPGGSTAPTTSTEAAVFSFKAVAGSGSTSLSFGSGSIVADNGSNIWNGSTAGASFNLATPSSSNGGSSSSGSKSGGSKSGGGSNSKSASTNQASTSNGNSSSNSQVAGASTTNNSQTSSNGTSSKDSKNYSNSKTGSKTSAATVNKPISSNNVSFIDYASGVLAAIVLGLIGFRFLTIRQGKPMPSIYRLRSQSGATTITDKPKTFKPSKSTSATAVASSASKIKKSSSPKKKTTSKKKH